MKRHYDLRLCTAALGVILILSLIGSVQTSPVDAANPSDPHRPPLPAWILGPMHAWWAPEASSAPFLHQILDQYTNRKVPLTTFHFDAWAWETCANNAQLKFDDGLISRLRTSKIRALFWIIPLITKPCAEYQTALKNGYFVRDGQGKVIVTPKDWWQGEGSWIDFNNPAAVAYWHQLLEPLFARTTGVMGGFYLDDVRPDLKGDSSYFDALASDLEHFTRAHVPDGEIVLKRYGVNTADNTLLKQDGHVTYVNDFPTNFAGLRQGIQHVFETAALLPAPFNEFTAYDHTDPDAETYIRRMHWGAFQAVMEEAPAQASSFPWDPHYPAQVMQAFQYYATLHWELVPYLHTYDQLAYEGGVPLFRNPNAATFSTQIGDQFFVQYVTDYARTLTVTLPSGRWINYWDETKVYTGPTTFQLPVPLGREPIFVADGAIIPMQVRDATTGHGTTASAGALTVNLFPSAHSAAPFLGANGVWFRFRSWLADGTLTLCADPAPSLPIIYRIARWSARPNSVVTLNGAVGVNLNWGRALPALANETNVDASAEGWFFDAARAHLIVKISQLGTACPNSHPSMLDWTRFGVQNAQ